MKVGKRGKERGREREGESGVDKERRRGERETDGCNRAIRAIVDDRVGLSRRVLLQLPVFAPTSSLKLNTA